MASEIIGMNDYLPKLLECRKCYNNIWRIEISALHSNTDDNMEKKTLAVSYSCGICDNRITHDQLQAGITEIIKAKKADVAEAQ